MAQKFISTWLKYSLTFTVHQVRNTLKYVASKDMKAFANDLKTIYHAPNAELDYEQLLEAKAKWEDHYPNAMKSWETNWDVISAF